MTSPRSNKISEERKNTAQKELDDITKRLKSAVASRNQAQSALDALVAATPQDAQARRPAVELAKFRLEVAEGRVEALQSLVEGLESLIQLENINYKAYHDRKAFYDATDPQQKAKALESLALLLDRLLAWKNVAENDISASSADLSKLESRAASITSEDPRFSLLNEQRAIKSETLAMLQRISQTVTAQHKLVDRWVTEFTPQAQRRRTVPPRQETRLPTPGTPSRKSGAIRSPTTWTAWRSMVRPSPGASRSRSACCCAHCCFSSSVTGSPRKSPTASKAPSSPAATSRKPTRGCCATG